MKSMERVTAVLLLICLALSPAVSDDLRHLRVYDFWNSVVSAHVRPGILQGISVNVVDYENISKDSNFTIYLDAIAKVNITGFNRTDTYAFFINVYNALAIKMILSHPCKKSINGSCQAIESIRDIGTSQHPVWKMPAGMVAGRKWSLDDVENYLRDPKPFQEDSRLHACIVCASISCPNVRLRAYQPEILSTQMDDNMRDFLANPKKGHYLDKSANVLRLSPIFHWFQGDFDQYGGVVKFLSHYLPADEVEYITSHNPSLLYFDYNWDVNGVPPCHC